jgi:hypothetical protein
VEVVVPVVVNQVVAVAVVVLPGLTIIQLLLELVTLLL